MNAEINLLIGSLRRVVAGRQEPLCLDVDWDQLLNLAQAHMLLPLLYDGLHRDPADWNRVPEDARKILQHAFFQAVYQDSHMDLLRQQLSGRLTGQGIAHIFLKGSEIKGDYPLPALRTMCDMDVLIHTEDIPRVAAISEALGGTLTHSDGNHRNYTFPRGITVEFHPNLLHQDTPIGATINPGWQYARETAAPGATELTEEGFYLHTICHLAHHFADGGVGVRSVLDIWVIRHLRGTQPNRKLVEAELERCGLLDFTRLVEQLAECWFSEGEMTPLLKELEAYILTSGSHGYTDRSMLNAVTLSPAGTGKSAILRRAFFSREEMEDRFPWCRGKPWLLPAAWCVRAFRALTKHGRLVWSWGSGTLKVSRTDAARQKERLARFGIRQNEIGGKRQ